MLDRRTCPREVLDHSEQRTGAVASPAQPLLERTECEVAAPSVTQAEQIDECPLARVETDERSVRQRMFGAPDVECVGVEAVPGDGCMVNGDRLCAAGDGNVAPGGNLVG